jgi:alkyl sulfatase BDS1-like metallo-beta-lactamase superfamily hydrolase
MNYELLPIVADPGIQERWANASFNPANRKPSIVKVNERIIVAGGYGFTGANMVVIDTGDGLALVDTMEGPGATAKAKEDLGALMEKLVKNVIYTHHHGDHTGGTATFIGEGTKVIATRAFVDMLTDYNARLQARIMGDVAIQYNIDLKPPQQPAQPAADNKEQKKLPAHVNVVFDDAYKFQQGELTFELHLAPGETTDHLFAWMPQLKTVCCGDMFYHAFPAISSPMKLNRCAYYWYRSIEKVLALEPEYLVPGHGAALKGKDQIREILTNYRDAIRFVDDKVIEALNNSVSVEQLRDEVRELPANLRDLPYLQENYGKLSWALEGDYRYYVGWFYGNATWLEPLPPVKRYTELVQLAGGADRIVERAINLQKEGHDQLALEMLDIVLTVEPGHQAALAVKANSLQRLGTNSDNLNSRGFYTSDAARTAKKLQGKE